jgi:transmembrane sensor
MSSKPREAYEVEDFVTDESFINFHFRLNPADEASWKVWLDGQPGKKAIVQQARKLIETLSLSLGDAEYAIELNKIKKAITDQASVPGQYLPSEKGAFDPVQKKRLRALLVPALVALVVAGAYFLYNRNNSANQLTETANANRFPITLVLSDSTSVTLAPQSTLRYPKHFSSTRRDVYLKGDAEFFVKRNEKAPFRVFSENIVATVLGTIFNFKKGGDSSIVIELLKGKLNVQLNEGAGDVSPIILYPNEKVVYVKGAHALLKKMEGRTNIAFQQNSFQQIAIAIKNAFGITVINKSNKTNWRFTGTFKNATAKEVIENICFVENLTADVKADTIYIK